MLEVKSGQRIKLISMPNDPNPIPCGATGMITDVNKFGEGANLSVRWDPPYQTRSLNILVPEDKFVIIKE